ncbi:exosortase A [Aestuariirhabdus litorea]|uniref:exosortase A n=1 Tax=Aestuariirhabdus litorea TaxID=2528527 RepID=UPI0013E3683F|nr:exosortase A [Aestuariirhabdus litorea]
MGINPWPRALLTYLVGAAIVLVGYRDTLTDMVLIWSRSGTFSHCFIIAPICFYLVYRKRAELRGLSPSPSWIGCLLVALLIFIWTLAEIVEVQVVQQFSLVLILCSLVLATMGWRVTLTLLFPLSYSLFMVPFGEFLIQPMMEMTASFTVKTIAALGIPIYVEGLFFELPTGNWSVVEGCSGVRYLIASTALGTLYAYINYNSMHKRVIFILASIALPIVGNWLRATGIVLLGHYSGMQLAVGVDHLLYGWVFFGVLMLILFMVGSRWSDPLSQSAIYKTAPRHYRQGVAVAILLVVLPAIIWSVIATKREPRAADFSLAVSYQGAALDPDNGPLPFEPRFQAADASGRFRIDTPLAQGRLLAYWYGYGPESNKLVTSTNRIVPQKDPLWRAIALSGEDASCPRSNLLRVESATETYEVISWYLIDGAAICDPVKAKLAQLLLRLKGGEEQGVHMALILEPGSRSDAPAALEQLIAGIRYEGVAHAP